MSETAEKITIVLGEYKGIKIPKQEVTVTEEEIEAELKRAQKMAAKKAAKDGEAETGDETVIDFTGYIDGEAFPGGDGKDYPLILGSGSFIPGFEEQLLGSKKGDHVEVKVSFPANYHAAEFAGKAAVFQVDVKEVRTAKMPEIGDEMAAAVSPCKTLAEFKDYIKSEIVKHKEQELSVEVENAIVNKIMETTTITVPKKDIETAAENLKQGFINQLTNSGQTLEAYLEYNGMTMQQFEDSAIAQAEHMIKGQSLLAEVAKREGLEVMEAELERELRGMAVSYQMDQEKLKELLGEQGLELVKQDIAAGKAMDFLLASAIQE
ncbi:Trigger factor [uncultured Roseburia sp.]|uniref:peptidylprolyl isomerase n=1 Tax=Brotonthovivens ammoniilytica TaxID=2981725 RepID=A0ABT2TP56_9FIRM|nr:trigger factor [Brotonthovivens ammoniilytica]MCU6763486.1 trigger factor [Brotonthovivens ammoniilytica]SCJ21052.1 Trigger factor [uncultured Roseburia sp.]